MTLDIDTAIEKLTARGYMVRPLDGRSFDVDGRLVATQREILELADEAYSVAELHERFVLNLSSRK
jgi:hypothetical protein